MTVIQERQKQQFTTIASEISDLQQALEGSVLWPDVVTRSRVLERLAKLRKTASAAASDPTVSETIVTGYRAAAMESMASLSSLLLEYGAGQWSMDEDELRVAGMAAQIFASRVQRYLDTNALAETQEVVNG